MTRIKQDHFNQFLVGLWLKWVDGARRHPFFHDTIVYFDVNAGSGFNDHPEARCVGSPLVFLRNACNTGISYEAHFIEKDVQRSEDLRDRTRNYRNVFIHNEDNKTCLPNLLNNLKNGNDKRDRLGLVYLDPNSPFDREMCELDFLANICSHPYAKRIDVLMRLSATTLKRVRSVHQKYNKLDEYIGAIKKTMWLIKEPISWDGQQWTFIFGANYKYGGWTKEGWHRLDSNQGKDIIDKLSLTPIEIEKKMTVPMFPTEPIPNT